jgi:AcrR family transcriptional regulator
MYARDQVTVRAIARQAGVAPQSFYPHFATIDELLWDVYARE